MKRSFIHFPIALCVLALVSCSNGSNSSTTKDSTNTNNAAYGTDSATENSNGVNRSNTGTIPDSTSNTGNSSNTGSNTGVNNGSNPDVHANTSGSTGKKPKHQ